MTNFQNLLYFKLGIFKVSGKAMIAILLSLVSTLNGINWSAFTTTQKFVAIGVAIGQGWSIVDAFLDTTMADLKDAKPAADAAQKVEDAKNALANPAPPATNVP
jgi:hypothetical protein